MEVGFFFSIILKAFQNFSEKWNFLFYQLTCERSKKKIKEREFLGKSLLIRQNSELA